MKFKESALLAHTPPSKKSNKTMGYKRTYSNETASSASLVLTYGDNHWLTGDSQLIQNRHLQAGESRSEPHNQTIDKPRIPVRQRWSLSSQPFVNAFEYSVFCAYCKSKCMICWSVCWLFIVLLLMLRCR